MPTGRPRLGRHNEEGAWGFGAEGISKGLRTLEQGELARGLGLLEQGEISKGFGAWALSRNVVSPLAGFGRGKKGKTQKLKRTKSQHLQQLLFHFMLVLFCYLT